MNPHAGAEEFNEAYAALLDAINKLHAVRVALSSAGAGASRTVTKAAVAVECSVLTLAEARALVRGDMETAQMMHEIADSHARGGS